LVYPKWEELLSTASVEPSSATKQEQYDEDDDDYPEQAHDAAQQANPTDTIPKSYLASTSGMAKKNTAAMINRIMATILSQDLLN
jgi:hypothetical protein